MNQRPADYESAALPLSYAGGNVGFACITGGFGPSREDLEASEISSKRTGLDCLKRSQTRVRSRSRIHPKKTFCCDRLFWGWVLDCPITRFMTLGPSHFNTTKYFRLFAWLLFFYQGNHFFHFSLQVFRGEGFQDKGRHTGYRSSQDRLFIGFASYQNKGRVANLRMRTDGL